jgi:hypothetical protein
VLLYDWFSSTIVKTCRIGGNTNSGAAANGAAGMAGVAIRAHATSSEQARTKRFNSRVTPDAFARRTGHPR